MTSVTLCTDDLNLVAILSESDCMLVLTDTLTGESRTITDCSRVELEALLALCFLDDANTALSELYDRCDNLLTVLPVNLRPVP